MSRRGNLLRNEISNLTLHLIQSGLAIDQNFAERKDVSGLVDISWPASGSVAFARKGFPYKDAYLRFVQERTFTAKLFDGSLIQLSYRFNGEDLIGHRLCYLPRPKEIEVNDVIRDEVLSNAELPIIRMDFSPESAKPFSHPMTHMHIGYEEVCRIPTSAPCTPARFVLFILRSFYSDKVTSELEKALNNGDQFGCSLTKEELGESYFKVPHL